MSVVDSKALAHFRGHSCRDLYKAIFEADAPEQLVRQLPTQTLFMIVKSVGLPSAAELISMASLEQCRLLSDFDLWNGDSLNEAALWEWLALTDEVESLELLQKLVKFVDLKLFAILFGKYIEVKIFDDPTEQPPGEGFHTPDRGATWIGIKTEDPDKHFLLARLLALIFESSAELFYQLISIVTVATASMLEEESYQERMKRLAAEGIPEPEAAAEIHAPYSMAEARTELASASQRGVVEDIRSIEPLIYEARTSRLFADLVRDVVDRDALEMEFTYIMNGAIVRWGVDFTNHELVLELAEQVKGAINIGLERMEKGCEISVLQAFERLGLGKLYRLGLTELMALRTKARKMPLDGVGDLQESDPVLFSVLACAREAFPVMPIFLANDGSVQQEGGILEAGHRPIDTAQDSETVVRLLDTIVTRVGKS